MMLNVKREPDLKDRDEARRILLGQGTVFIFNEHGHLCMPDGKMPSHEYSLVNRGVQAAIVDLLLTQDPEGKRFLVDAKEALTDQMMALAARLSDKSDDHPEDTLAFIDEDMQLTSKPDDEDNNDWINGLADLLRCEKKHAHEEKSKGAFPITKYRGEFPAAFAFFDTHKLAIENRAEERENAKRHREKYHGMPPVLRSSEGFWDSVRITVQVTLDLLKETEQSISRPTSEQTKQTLGKSVPTFSKR
jgi:hypothetical protein